MEDLSLDAHTVAVWEDGFRTAEAADHSFEWWYFDMQLDDGSTLVATFNTQPSSTPDGPLDPSVLLIYHGPDGTRIRNDGHVSADEFSAADEGCDVRIGANTVQGDLARSNCTSTTVGSWPISPSSATLRRGARARV